MDNKIPQRDRVGAETLMAINKAHRFNRWMFETIRPFCKGRVLEIGSGIGNISSLILSNGNPTMLSDFNPDYCQHLDAQFSSQDNYLGVTVLDLVHENFEKQYADLLGTFDAMIALNVIEHIEDDQMALLNCRKLLKKDGRLIILVPAYQQLYNGFDKGLGHFRRYTSASMAKIFEVNQLKVIHQQYFNFVGILGWYVSGKIMKNDEIPSGQMSLYNFFVPIIKIIDKLLLNKVGLSTITVGVK